MEVEAEQEVHEIEVPDGKLEPPENEYEEYEEEEPSEEERMNQRMTELKEEIAVRFNEDMRMVEGAIEDGYVKVIDDVEKLVKENKELREQIAYLDKEFKRIRKREVMKRVFKWATSRLWRKPKIKKSVDTHKKILYLRHNQDKIKEDLSKGFKETQENMEKRFKEVDNRQVVHEDLLLDRIDTYEKMQIGLKERVRRLENGERRPHHIMIKKPKRVPKQSQ